MYKQALVVWLIAFWCLVPLSAILLRPVLVVEEAGENHGQATGKLPSLPAASQVHPF